jgi:uncharacterized protein YqgV (UPF0045/DUF77 family)
MEGQMEKIDEAVKAVAIKLASYERYSPHSTVTVVEGFSVPTWLTFVSRAQQLVAERSAFGK